MINNTIFKPTNVKTYIGSRILSPDFLPHSMNLIHYGALLRKDNNILYFQYNEKYIIKVEVLELNVHHNLEIFRYKDQKGLAIVQDFM